VTLPQYTQRQYFWAGPSPAQALSQHLQIMASPSVGYDFSLSRVDINGNVLEDLTPYVLRASAHVERDCTATVHGTIGFQIAKELVWGKDMVAPVFYEWAPNVFSGVAYAFPLGVFVATTPERNLDPFQPFDVTGYDKNYLLQSTVGNSWQLAAGLTYKAGLEALLVLAGAIPNVSPWGQWYNWNGDWATKTTPIDLVYPLSDSSQWTYIAIANELLKASGQMPLFTDEFGKYTVAAQVPAATQANSWAFAADQNAFSPAGFPTTSATVTTDVRTVTRDVWNVPNQWVFIQQGLTFAPVEGSGQYTVNNTTTPPSDQTTIGRIIRTVQYLNASGQTDLRTQGDAIVQAQLSQAEKIDFSSAPWPVAWHYDVLQYSDSNLPSTPVRKVQAQKWSLPLIGNPQTWETLVVGAQ
jgi:hypothetical protein